MAKETKTVKELTEDKKDQLLADTLKAIEKEYGKGSIMKLGDRAEVSVDAIPSGSLALDQALGIGGYPKGRIIEIYGPESSGKTTLALHAIAECQKQGGRCAFIDAENAIDPVYAKNLGVDIDELILSQPDSGEQALEITELLIKSGAIDLVVIDSVAALVPQAELDGEMGDASVGLQARLMSKAMRKLAGVMNRSNTTAIFINQLREKVGIMFGNPETTPGGRALKFYASVRQSMSSTAKESVISTRSSTWRLKMTSSTRPAPGSPTMATRSARASTPCANMSAPILNSTLKSQPRSRKNSSRRKRKPLRQPNKPDPCRTAGTVRLFFHAGGTLRIESGSASC